MDEETSARIDALQKAFDEFQPELQRVGELVAALQDRVAALEPEINPDPTSNPEDEAIWQEEGNPRSIFPVVAADGSVAS